MPQTGESFAPLLGKAGRERVHAANGNDWRGISGGWQPASRLRAQPSRQARLTSGPNGERERVHAANRNDWHCHGGKRSGDTTASHMLSDVLKRTA